MQSLYTAVVIAKHLIGINILNYELHTYDILSSLYTRTATRRIENGR